MTPPLHASRIPLHAFRGDPQGSAGELRIADLGLRIEDFGLRSATGGSPLRFEIEDCGVRQVQCAVRRAAGFARLYVVSGERRMIFLHASCFSTIQKYKAGLALARRAQKRIQESFDFFDSGVFFQMKGSVSIAIRSSPSGNTGAGPGSAVEVKRRHSPARGAIEVF